MKLSKSKKIILLSSSLIVLLLVALWFLRIKPALGLYKVKRENFEAVITCKGEIQSEKAVLIMLPDVFLNQYGQSLRTNQLRAIDENELPPRY